MADILKYVYEEPAVLEPVVPDHDPDARRRAERSDVPADETILHGDPFDTDEAYRGYLAGTNRAEGRVGLTTLRPPEAYTDPLLEALGADWWGRGVETGAVEALAPDAARRVLRRPGPTTLLVTAPAPVDEALLAAVAEPDRRRGRPALQGLLDAATVAFFPEPAHDGTDWGLWSARPIRDRLVAAFREHPVETVRRVVIPYAKARSESKFYFDSWHPTDGTLPDYVEEV